MTTTGAVDAVTQFVAGTMSLGAFVRLLHDDLALREYLASGGDREPGHDLLGQMLAVVWQDVVQVHDAQQVLERVLRAEGVKVDPTQLYAQRVAMADKLAPLLAQVQEPWLKIPVAYFALLLKECSTPVGNDIDDLMRRRVKNRFRCLTHPPQWLHEEYWPVGRNGPLVFVTQVEAAPQRPGTAVNYIFIDPRTGAFLVLPQTADPGGPRPPVPPQVQAPRGVVPVFARPGAFWLRPAQSADDEGGDVADVPAATPAPAVPLRVPTALPDNLAPIPPTTPVTDGPPLDLLDDSAPAPRPAVPVAPAPPTLPVNLALLSGDDGDLEATVMADLPSFQPWTLALADGRRFCVQSRSFLVGRRPQTDEPGVQLLPIMDSTRSLSKTHARMDLVNGMWQVVDLSSTNGVVVTTVDGHETKVVPGYPTPVYGYVAFGSVEARLYPDQPV